MQELLNKDLKVGDLVIPLITHTGKVLENSLFGIVVGFKEVFMYDEKTQTYKKKVCSKCYKMEIDDDIKKNQLGILIKEYNNWTKLERPVLKSEMSIGDVLYKKNKSGTIDYYIYLGKYRIILSNINGEVSNQSVYTRYNHYYVKYSYLDNITLLDSLIEKGTSVDLSYLLFGSIRHSIFSKSITDILHIKSSLLKGLYRCGHLSIDNIENKSLLASNVYFLNVYENTFEITNYNNRIKTIEFIREK